ncbi:MAG: toll/interleukin-1 receptor domain-containing protein, partial [Verrucomicrobiales bacterium]
SEFRILVLPFKRPCFLVVAAGRMAACRAGATMSGSSKYQVFICSSKGKGAVLSAVVKLVVSRLEDRGIGCWSPHRDLEKGSGSSAAKKAQIDEAIARSEVFLPISYGADENASADTRSQVEQAIENGVPVIPFRLKKPGQAADSGEDNWLEAVDTVLDQRVDTLVSKIELLVGASAGGEACDGEEAEDRERDGKEPARKTSLPTPREKEAPTLAPDTPQSPGRRPIEKKEKRPSDPGGKEMKPKGQADSGDGIAADEKQEDGALEGERVSFPLPPATFKAERVPAKGGSGSGKSTGFPRQRKSRPRSGKDSERESTGAGEGNLGEQEQEPERRTNPVPWVIASVFLVTFLIAYQVFSTPPTMSNLDRNVQELELLGFSLNSYAAAHEGKYPPALDALKGMRSNGAALRWRDYNEKTEQEFIYFEGRSWADHAATILAAGPYPVEEGERAVLYLDGTVRMMKEELFQQRLEKGSIRPSGTP